MRALSFSLSFENMKLAAQRLGGHYCCFAAVVCGDFHRKASRDDDHPQQAFHDFVLPVFYSFIEADSLLQLAALCMDVVTFQHSFLAYELLKNKTLLLCLSSKYLGLADYYKSQIIFSFSITMPHYENTSLCTISELFEHLS